MSTESIKDKIQKEMYESIKIIAESIVEDLPYAYVVEAKVTNIIEGTDTLEYKSYSASGFAKNISGRKYKLNDEVLILKFNSGSTLDLVLSEKGLWGEELITKGLDGKEGPMGPPGIPGKDGEDGKQTYSWIAFADTPTSGISFDPAGKKYVGYAFNMPTEQPSTNYSDYKWQLTKGEDGAAGVPGKPGEDGKVYYTWVKYADTPISGMSDYPEGKRYIGLAFNKETKVESKNYRDYEWSYMPQNITIGGRNLAPIREFEKFGQGYELEGYKFKLDAMNPIDGIYSSGIKIPNSNLEDNTEYTITWKSRLIEGEVYIFAGHTSGLSVKEYFINGRKIGNGFFAGEYPKGNDIVEHELHFKTNRNYKDNLYFQPNRIKYDKAYKMDIWDIKLERGDIATDWTPAPEDLEEVIDTIEKEVIRVNTLIEQLEDSISLQAQKITETEKGLIDAEGSIAALDKDLKTQTGRIDIQSDKIELTVKETNQIKENITPEAIVSSINLSSEEIQLNSNRISLSGHVTANGNVSFSEDGKITAKKGKIADFEIDGSRLISPQVVIDGGVHDGAIWVGNDGKWSHDTPIRLYKNGLFVAKNAQIEGKVVASSGVIGGWNIGSYSMWSGRGTPTSMILDTGNLNPYAIMIGGDNPYQSPFVVNKNGSMIASDAFIQGTVNAETYYGKITLDDHGVTITNSNGITQGRIHAPSILNSGLRDGMHIEAPTFLSMSITENDGTSRTEVSVDRDRGVDTTSITSFDNIYIMAGRTATTLRMTKDGFYFAGDFRTEVSGDVNIGTTGRRFRAIYLTRNPNVASDIRQKRILNKVENAREFMSMVDVYEFNSLFSDDEEDREQINLGFIAQDIERANYKLNKKNFSYIEKDESYLSLDYTQIILYNWQVTKELIEENKALEERIKILERSLK